MPIHSARGSTRSSPFVDMPRAWRYAFLALLFLYGLVTVGGALIHTTQNASCVYLALSTAFYLGALSYPLFRYDEGRSGWLHPLIFSTLYFGFLRTLPRVAGIYMFGLEEHAALPLGPEELTLLVAYENVLNGLALFCTYFGYHLFRNYRAPRFKPTEPQALGPLVAVAALASVVALGLYVNLSGSLFQHIRNLGLNATAKEFSEDVSGVGLYITTAQWFGLFLCILLVYRYKPEAKRPERLRFWAVWLPLFLVANAIGYLALGKRSGMIITFGLFAIVLVHKLRRVPWTTLLSGGAAIIVLFAAIQVSRGSASTAKTMEDISAAISQNTGESAAGTMEELVNRRGSYASVYPILHYVPEDSPLLWGETYLTIFTRPIPRAWWPSKPRGTDFRAGATFFGASWGIPPGAVGEAFWNFHIPGVILVFLVYGAALRGLANIFSANPDNGLVVVVYAYCLLNFIPAENALTGCLQMTIPFALFAFFSGALRRAHSSA